MTWHRVELMSHFTRHDDCIVVCRYAITSPIPARTPTLVRAAHCWCWPLLNATHNLGPECYRSESEKRLI